jgi:hypothetical protein
MFTTSTSRRQLRRLIGVTALATAFAAIPAGAALADGAGPAGGATGKAPAAHAPSVPARAKNTGKAPSGHAAKRAGIFVFGGNNPVGVFDEILTRYAWQRTSNGIWVRASRIFHHANFGGEYGYLWDYWNGSQAITYAICLPSTGCQAY